MEEWVVCSFVTRSSSGAAASIPAIHVHEASHPSAACWCVGSGKEERGRGVQHTMCVSGEDHNQAVAHAATGLGGKPDKEKIRGGGRSGGGEKRGVACAPGSQGEKKKGGREDERGEGSKVEKQRASHLCPHVLQPCHHAMLLREECIHVHANAWQSHAWHLMPSSP